MKKWTVIFLYILTLVNGVFAGFLVFQGDYIGAVVCGAGAIGALIFSVGKKEGFYLAMLACIVDIVLKFVYTLNFFNIFSGLLLPAVLYYIAYENNDTLKVFKEE